MSAQSTLNELISRTYKTIELLQNNQRYFSELEAGDFQKLGRNNTSAIVAAELVTDYYTCLETLFFRISQFFENNLDNHQWHKDLLDKMTIAIKDVRQNTISDLTAQKLSELLNFRHFKRYYFKHNYDWDKLDFLVKKYREVHPDLVSELRAFIRCLGQYLAACCATE